MLDPSPPFTDSQGRPRSPSPISARSQDWSRLPRFLGRRFRSYASEVRQIDGPQRTAYLHAKLGVVRDLVVRKDLFRGDRSEMHRIAVYEANQRAGRRYGPGPYHGPVIVAFTDSRVLTGARNYRLDWLDLMPQCESPHYVPGRDTGDMLIPPNVYTLAKCVNVWLEEAHARVVGTPDHPLPERRTARAGASRP